MSILNDELILRNVSVRNANEFFDHIAKVLENFDFVEPSYLDNIKEREAEFPTGLKGCSIAVAIPHTNSEHVKTNAIGVVVLDEPIQFIAMGSDDEILDVEIIFPLIVKSPKEHIGILSKMMRLVQDEASLQEIKDAEDNETIKKIVNKFLV